MSNALPALAEPRRQRLLELVWDEERAAGDIAAAMPEVTFGAVSQHLKILRDAGLVTVRREGRRRFYAANRGALGPLATYLEALWRGRLAALAEEAEAAERAASAPETGETDDDHR
jgi:DNA-binding transcriptional ArsR family regulator